MTTNQYEAEQQTREQAHTNSVREIAESRTAAKQALTRAEATAAPPHRTVLDTTPPNPDEPPQTNAPTKDWVDPLMAAHAATLEYWNEIRPYRHNVPDLWDEHLTTVPVPQPGDWETISQRHSPDHEIQHIEYTDRTISLTDVDWWRFQRVTLRGRKQSINSDPEPVTREEKVFLPPAACSAVYEQLNDILEELGLAAEVREVGEQDTDPGVPNDIDAWDQ